MTKICCIVGLVVIAAAGCGGGETPARSCTATSDCAAGQVCAAGFCINEGRACSATTACPGNLNCCAGTCSEGACCQADYECSGGYCDSSVCNSGTRPTCTSDVDCGGSGQCLSTLGSCVECIASGDCNPGFGCSPQHTCIVETGCTAAGCIAQGKVCAPEQGQCRQCVSDAECGQKICENGSCIDCTASNQCDDDRTCVDGNCVREEGSVCGNDADCGGLICVSTGQNKTCQPCFADYECVGGVCTDHRCFGTSGECQGDADCDVPTEICNYDTCAPSCITEGCAEGDICNPNTGRCVPFSDGTVDIGDACDTHSDCLTNVCWPIDTSPTTAVRRCGQACSTHSDCPDGTICYELGDSATCLPKEFLEDDGAYNVAPGGTCTDEFLSTQCVTSYCDASANTCYEMCGNASDCASAGTGTTCMLRRLVMRDKDGDGTVEQAEYAFTSLCEVPDAGTLQPGATCTADGLQPTDRDHDKCSTGYCVQTPDLYQRARCASGCCSPSDCTPSAPICKPIDVWDGLRQGGPDTDEPYGYQKVCLYREWTGTKQLGATCTNNSECASEICAQGVSGVKRCTQTCCTNSDCAGLGWSSGCRPPFYNSPTSTGEESVADSQFDQLVHALGRQTAGYGQPNQSFAVSPICFPE